LNGEAVKKTRRKNIFRGIRGSLNRFFSILFIVALGSGFMAGLAATSPDMYATADKYADDCNLYDLDIKSALGFDDSDLAAICAEDITKHAMPAKVNDIVLTTDDGEEYTSRVYGILDGADQPDMNGFVLKEGRMPENSGECVIQPIKGRYFEGGIKIGDTLSVKSNTAVCNELKVVGFVESPMSMAIVSEPSSVGMGSIALDVYVYRDFYSFDYYTDIYLSVNGASDLDTFGNKYDSLIDSAVDAVEALGKERSEIQTKDMISALNDSINAIGLLKGYLKQPLTEDLIKLLKAKTDEIKVTYSGTPEIITVFEPLLSTINDLSANGNTEALSKSIEEATANAEAMRSKLSEIRWIVRTRNDAVGFSTYESNVGKVAALSKIFPVFFFMVSLLVSLTTMTRLVEENRTQIGTLKALGFSNGQILGEYISYSMLSSALGCLLGFSVGFRLFPSVISSAYGMLFVLPKINTPIRWDIVLWVAPVTVLSILLATVWSCWNEFRSCPAKLMQRKAPVAGKRILLERITPFWNRFSFTKKVTARNLFRYKKRFYMTIIGVAGCSALLVTGFGIRDSINDIVDKQYGEIYRYQLNLLTDGEKLSDELTDTLGDKSMITSWLPFANESGKVIFNGKSESVSLNVPSDLNAFSDFIALRERKTKNDIKLSNDGAVLTEKLCETLGIAVGDTVEIESSDGSKGSIKVSGIAENYISSIAYLSNDLYREAFGEEPNYRYISCVLPNTADSDKITARLLEFDNILYINSSESLKSSFADSLKSIDGVVLVLILAAGLLSVVVLYNLTNVNVCERHKELATIRVLGFHKREAENYIFRETNALSIIGTVIGFAVGIWLHSFVVRTVEIDQVMFGRTIYPMSYLYSFLISFAFTLLVNTVMRRQIRKIDMAEAMKAND